MISQEPTSDALEQSFKSADLVPPTFTDSVFNSAKSGFYTGLEAVNKVNELTGGKPDENIQTLWDTVQEAQQKESEMATFGEKAKRALPDFIANGLGMLFNPVTAGLMELGAPIARGIGKIALNFAPELAELAAKPITALAGTVLEKYVPKSVGELTKGVTHGAAVGAVGFGVPEGIINNYNADTKSLNWGGVVEDVSKNGAMGALLSIPGYAVGVFFNELFNGKPPMPGEDPSAGEKLDAAYQEGKIPKDEYDWGKMFYEDPHNPDLQKQAAEILLKKGHDIDAAKFKAFMSMVSEDDWKNLSAIFPDQLNNADSVTDKTAMSDFVLGNSLDKMRDNPALIDGMRGVLAELNYKLKGKTEKLKEADAIVDDHLHLGLQDRMPFDQQDIYDQVKANPTEHLPYTIPDNIDNVINKDKKAFSEYVKHLESTDKFEKINTSTDLTKHPFYHGTGELENIEDFDISRGSEFSLFGQGLYITDSKPVALGYAKARGKFTVRNQPDTGKILELKFKKEPKLIDLERSPNEDIFEIIKKEALKKDVKLGDPLLHKYTIEEIYKIIKDEIFDNEDHSEAIESYGDLLFSINNELESKGYDGYNHTGGTRVGKQRKHNVIILFGHHYMQNGKEFISNPGKKLLQKTVDVAHDYNEKLKQFKDIKLQTPKEELTHIKEKLLTDKGLPKNWQRSKEYARLVDLADVWHNAKTLLDRVDLEAQYNKQEAYKNLLDNYLKVLDSNIEKFADQERVMSALKEKIDKHAGIDGEYNAQIKPERPYEQIIKEAGKVPADADEQLVTFDEQVKAAQPEEQLSVEYNESKKRYQQFKKGTESLAKMMDCLGRQI